MPDSQSRPRHPPLITLSPAYLRSLVQRAVDGGYCDREAAYLNAKVRGFDQLVRDEQSRRAAEAFEIRLASMRAAEAADAAFRDEMGQNLAAQDAAADMLAVAIDMSQLPPPHRDAVLRLAQVDEDRYATAVAAIERRHRVPDSYTSLSPDRTRRDSEQERGSRAALAAAHRDAAFVMGVVEAVLDAIEPPPAEVSTIGRRLAVGNESEIHEASQEEAEKWRRLFRLRGPAFRELADYEVQELTCPRWHKRKLRRESLRAQAFYDGALRMCRSSRPYVSFHTLHHWEERQRRAAEWARLRVIQFSDGQCVAMTDVQKSAREGRRARLWAVSKGIECIAARNGYVAMFITITLPGRFHPTTTDQRGVRRDNPNWSNEFGPQAQGQELNRIWTLFRARMAKLHGLRGYFGIIVPEPHEDGTPHLHALLYVPAQVTRGGAARPTVNVLRRELSEAAGAADSGVMSPGIPGNSRPPFRADVARDSDLMSPTVPI